MTVTVANASATAIEKVEAAGGSVNLEDSDDFDEATRLQDLVTAVEGRIDAELARVSKEEFQALDC